MEYKFKTTEEEFELLQKTSELLDRIKDYMVTNNIYAFDTEAGYVTPSHLFRIGLFLSFLDDYLNEMSVTNDIEKIEKKGMFKIDLDECIKNYYKNKLDY